MLDHFWYVACTSRQLRKKPLAIELMEQRLVLFRDAQGQAAALRDLCPHRQVQLSLGRVQEGCIECPYHGWRFDAQGDCVFVPSLCEGDKIPPRSQVRRFPIREQQGYIWLWLGEGEPDHEPFSLPFFGQPGWAATRIQSDVENAVDNIVENFIDCPHTGYIHAGLFRAPATQKASAQISVFERHLEIDITEEKKSDSFFSKILLQGDAPKHIDSFYLPSIVQVSYEFSPSRHFLGVQMCTPISPYKTRVFVYVTWKMGIFTQLIRPVVPWVSRWVLHQDLGILANQAEQLQRYDKSFVSVPADAGNNLIAQLRKRAAAGTLGEAGDEALKEGEASHTKEIHFRL
ncbi:MAG: aromatic ring-hydroxylating dioxygenase subunit alpha [Myxococcales bacterium]|nr:aromatic ring-hydroxylating dioxygenase subunit alpha [Myxococcales bacterium]